LDTINVVAWGNREGKVPADLDHKPKNKRHLFKDGGGWTCPK
jgi:hypothetical protein